MSKVSTCARRATICFICYLLSNAVSKTNNITTFTFNQQTVRHHRNYCAVCTHTHIHTHTFKHRPNSGKCTSFFHLIKLYVYGRYRRLWTWQKISQYEFGCLRSLESSRANYAIFITALGWGELWKITEWEDREVFNGAARQIRDNSNINVYCTCLPLRAHFHACTHAHTHTYTHTYTNISTYTHKNTYTQVQYGKTHTQKFFWQCASEMLVKCRRNRLEKFR